MNKQVDIVHPGSQYPSGPIVLGIIITLLLTYPGFMYWDSVIQLGQARSGSYSNLHPPMMAFLWRQVELVITGPFGMLLIQVTAIWTGLYFVQKYYLNHWCRIGALMPMLVVFYPPVFGIVGLISKDIQMTAWLVLATGLATKVVQYKNANGKILLLSSILFLVVLWLALAQRHNAAGAVPGLVWFLLFSLLFTSKNLSRRLLYTFCIAMPATIILFLLAITANNQLTSLDRHPWVQIAVFDIVGTAAFSNDHDFMDQTQISSMGGVLSKHPVTKEEIVASYRPHEWSRIFKDGPFVDLWKYRPTESERKAVVDLWLHSVRTYPSAYLYHRFTVFREVLGLGDHRSSGVQYTDWQTFAGKKKAERLHHEATLSPLQSLAYLVMKGVQKFTPLFKPYIYVVISILCLIAGARLLGRGLSSLPFFLALSGLGYEATLFLAAPTSEYRYSYWMILSSVLSLVLIVIHTTRKNNMSNPGSSKSTACVDDRASIN